MHQQKIFKNKKISDIIYAQKKLLKIYLKKKIFLLEVLKLKKGMKKV